MPAEDDGYYALLGVGREANAEELKKAYYRRAMKHHPDKVTDPTERAAATARFQELSHAYHVLSDERLRRIYDQTGTVEAHELRDAADGDGRDWAAYWRDLFPPITEASVREFEAKYKGSEEETEDLKAAYLAAEGDMGAILDAVYFGSVDEEARYRALLERLIEAKTLPAFRAFSHESARKKAARQKKAARERAEAEEHAARLNVKTDADLTALIQSRRHTGMADLVARLEAKYMAPQAPSGSPRKRKGGVATHEPSEAEFAAAQQRLAAAAPSAASSKKTKTKK